MKPKERIDLYQFYRGLRKRIILVILLTIIGFFGGGVYAYFVKVPTYQVTTQMVVRSLSGGGLSQTNVQEVDGTIQLINTYNDIVVSPYLLNKVIAELHLPDNAADLKGLITPTNGATSQSQVLTLTVDYSDPKTAANIANTTAQVFKDNIKDIMNVSNVTILSHADASTAQTPIKPNRKLYTIVSTIIGFAVGMLVVAIMTMLDKSVKTEEELEELLDFPLLGTVPVMGLLNTRIGKQKKVKVK